MTAPKPKKQPQFYSEAQRERCKVLVEQKKMSQAEFEAMERATSKHVPLPKRVTPK